MILAMGFACNVVVLPYFCNSGTTIYKRKTNENDSIISVLLYKDGRQIVRRLSGGNLRHYCIFRNRLYVMVAQWWCGSVFIHEENVIGGSGWKHLRLHVAGHSGKTPTFHTKEELMETTFGCKATTFAYIWLLQWKNLLKHMGRCWYHDPLAP